ncbi:MAG TPA: HD domain-containing protein [Actinobacteria bacterium]|nr:HD domain-containing protein [Actinomycetota bacterium]
MADDRIEAISTGVFALLVGAAILFLGAPWFFGVEIADPLGVFVWAILIAAAHLGTVPTPSGDRINLGVAPAVAASILLREPLDLAGAYAFGMVAAWLVVQLRNERLGGRRRRSVDRHGGFLTETLAMAIYGVAYLAVYERAIAALERDWAVLAAVAGGGLAWFLARATVSALLGLERVDLSPRYLWLLALEDWNVVLALISAGVLFGLAWPRMGLWAVPLAVLPYGFSHVAFERYDFTRTTYGQTIRALSQIPEVAGLAPTGHSVRTADLAVAMAKELGLHPKEVQAVEYAAMLHDVGRITLNEPAIIEAGYTEEDLARWGSQIIAEAPYLEHVAELVALQTRPYRRPGIVRDEEVPVASQIIKVASAFDEGLNELGLGIGGSLERLYEGSVYDYDPRVLASLRRVLEYRGLVAR